MAAPATGGKSEAKPEPKAPPPEAARDELLLKFVGTGTLILGIVLLVSGVIAISILSILRYDVAPWLPIVPLSLLMILVGGVVAGHYRRVVDRILNPKPPEEPRAPPVGFVYPYQMAAPYPMQPPYAIARVPYATPAPAPGTAPASPTAGAKGCPSCGRPIPLDAKFCPYCRHVLA